jgi:hypothetical protein
MTNRYDGLFGDDDHSGNDVPVDTACGDLILVCRDFTYLFCTRGYRKCQSWFELNASGTVLCDAHGGTCLPILFAYSDDMCVARTHCVHTVWMVPLAGY